MSYTGVLPPIEPVSQWTIPEKNPNGEGGLMTIPKRRSKRRPWKFQKKGFTQRNSTKLCYTRQKF